MTPAEFKTAMPTFKDVDAAVIQRWIDDSASEVKEAALGDRYNRALRYWVAHNIALEQKWNQMGVTAKAGDVVSATKDEKEGRGTVTRSSAAVEAAQKNPYLKTEWGQLFWDVFTTGGRSRGKVVSASSRGYQDAGSPTPRTPGDFVGD